MGESKKLYLLKFMSTFNLLALVNILIAMCAYVGICTCTYIHMHMHGHVKTCYVLTRQSIALQLLKPPCGQPESQILFRSNFCQIDTKNME